LFTGFNDPDQIKVIEKKAEAEADLVFLPNSNKVMLTVQHPLVHVVIQDSFDILCTSLMFSIGVSTVPYTVYGHIPRAVIQLWVPHTRIRTVVTKCDDGTGWGLYGRIRDIYRGILLIVNLKPCACSSRSASELIQSMAHHRARDE
jgi:hypothetical protein